MQPLAIINVLEEVGKTILDIGHRPVLPEVDLLGLQGLDEALGRRIVVGVAFAGHADAEAVCKQLLHVVSGGILDPAIGVVDDPCRGSAKRQGHPEGLQAQGRVDAVGQGIAHDPAGKQIQDDRQIHEAAQDADVGDVGHPELVGARDQQVLREVRIDPMGMFAVRGADPAALGLSQQSLLAHDAKHLLVVVPEPATMQLLGHPTVSVAGEFFDDGLDAGDERLLLVGPAL